MHWPNVYGVGGLASPEEMVYSNKHKLDGVSLRDVVVSQYRGSPIHGQKYGNPPKLVPHFLTNPYTDQLKIGKQKASQSFRVEMCHGSQRVRLYPKPQETHATKIKRV